MASFLCVFVHFLAIFHNNHKFIMEKCSLGSLGSESEYLSNFIINWQKINKMHLLWLEMWFLVNFDVWYHDFSPLNQGLISQYHQLWVEYLIRNPKTPYNVSMPGYLTLVGYLRYCRWTISQIVGSEGVKISQNVQNYGFRWAKIMISLIVSIIFDLKT